VTALSLQALPDGVEKPVAGLPAEAKIRFAGWAPDARHVFFVNVSDAPADAGLSLWIVDVASAQARRVSGEHRLCGLYALSASGESKCWRIQFGGKPEAQSACRWSGELHGGRGSFCPGVGWSGRLQFFGLRDQYD